MLQNIVSSSIEKNMCDKLLTYQQYSVILLLVDISTSIINHGFLTLFFIRRDTDSGTVAK